MFSILVDDLEKHTGEGRGGYNDRMILKLGRVCPNEYLHTCAKFHPDPPRSHLSRLFDWGGG